MVGYGWGEREGGGRGVRGGVKGVSLWAVSGKAEKEKEWAGYTEFRCYRQ